MIDMEKQATQRQFADIIGVSESAVSGMVRSGVLVPGAPVGSWVKDYTAHLREQAAGRAASGDLDLAGERARLAKEQADKIALQNAVTRGELAPVSMIEEVLTKAASRISGVFDAIPGMVKRRIPGLRSEDIDLIAGEVAKARNIVAAMSLSDIQSDDDEQGQDDIVEVIV